MREMVLNHASLAPFDGGRTLAWFKDMALGMKSLIDLRVCSLQQGLRMSDKGSATIYSILFGESDAMSNPATREELQFLMSLGSRTPLLKDVDDDVEDRFRGCQEKTLPLEDGEPLLFCALTDGVAIGFPSEEVWDRDELTVYFDELLPDARFAESSETIDNLTRPYHAQPIHNRHVEAVRRFADRDALWSARDEVYSSIKFLPEVEGQLTNLDSIAWTKVARAFDHMETGNLLNAKGLGGGISEFRLHFGPGYRVYFGQEGSSLVVLRCGTKQGQNQDIQAARDLWQNYSGGN